MSWRGIIWIEAEDRSPLGGPPGTRHNLGTFSLPSRPQAADRLTIGGVVYEVVQADALECRVRRGEVSGLDPSLVFDP